MVNGIRFQVDISEFVSHYTYFRFEDLSHQKLLSLLNKNDIILDIGANIGATCLKMSEKTGGDGFVYGFEPSKSNFKECMSNIALNSFGNILVSNIGLGNSEGEFPIIEGSDGNNGKNRIELTNQNKSTDLVKIQTLDSWVNQFEIQAINVIKMDVEGFEFSVLSGGAEAIKKFKPIIFLELDDDMLKAASCFSN